MKAKKLNKKLTLLKETVANLDFATMEGIKGGWYTGHYVTCGDFCDSVVTCKVATWCTTC
jgi:hypothetical protein